MTTKMSIRELTRNGNMMGEYDYIEIEDRKSHAFKGIFVPATHADAVKAFLDKKIAEERAQKLAKIEKYAGKGSIQKRFGGLSASELRRQKAIEQYGK